MATLIFLVFFPLGQICPNGSPISRAHGLAGEACKLVLARIRFLHSFHSGPVWLAKKKGVGSFPAPRMRAETASPKLPTPFSGK
jgi:hypothetical protein